MRTKVFKANILLLITSLIWGFAFVAQRVGMDYVGPFTFNFTRFALGAFALIPVIYLRDKYSRFSFQSDKKTNIYIPGFIVGIIVFFGATFQQTGLVYTTAGKAGFITGLYVVLVPVFGLFLKQRINKEIWIGIIFALVGLYLLSFKGGFNISKGDLLVLIGAFFWAFHVLAIGHFVSKVSAIKLAFFQFTICSILSLFCALIFEKISLLPILDAAIPILYAGLMSVGIAYSLQIVGQKWANPSVAAIILSMETVFAVLGGWIVLGEVLSIKEVIGCILMFMAMIISQVGFNIREILKYRQKKYHDL